MATGLDVVNRALSKAGSRYVFGAKWPPSNPNPIGGVDCSGFVRWVCGQLGVTPSMPDGSWFQESHVRQHQTLIDISAAYRTPGALLGHPGHIVISRGDGVRTVEARGTAYGVGSFSLAGRGWTWAGLIPGVSYNAVPAAGPRILRLADPFMRGDDVAEVQTAVGLTGGAVDGVFGPNTDRAVRAFQGARGLTVDGAVGPMTRAQFTAAKTDTLVSGPNLKVDGAFGPQTVSALQSALRRHGQDLGPAGVDGDFGGATKRALQRHLGVVADGVIGSQTAAALRRKLNLVAAGPWDSTVTSALQRALNSGTF